MSQSDGGYVHAEETQLGITRRDWLAGLAMQGIISNHECMRDFRKQYNDDISGWEYVSQESYSLADAMIAESNK